MLAFELDAGKEIPLREFGIENLYNPKEAQMNGSDRILGLVERGMFRPLEAAAPSGSVRLTRISPQASQSPESGELDLAEYEGSAIMVVGSSQGGWIYSAEVIDQATPIVTELVRRVFGASAASR
jgi:hypothetical protein